ncbi:hypothetical protein [Thalassospira alkalitolerans]|uniref:hypothetical protein n=1 Tax=Thalassospira alkalitolerans TaxID=1293890 RepID=UPI003AA85651
MNINFATVLMVLTCAVSGCAQVDDHVLFVTNTSLGFDADAATGGVDFGFNRQEGVAGPAYDGGALPPVYARIKSDGGLFDRNVDQQYATGDAARIITGADANDTNALTKKSGKVFFVGTRTNYGLHIGMSEAGLASLSLGIKRQEISYIPLGKSVNGEADIYPSALASFETGVGSKTIAVGQLIATGDAAEALAAKPELKDKVTQQAKEAFAASRDHNSTLISKATDDDQCFKEVEKYIAEKIPTDTPAFADVNNLPAHADFRKQMVADKSLRSACHDFSE